MYRTTIRKVGGSLMLAIPPALLDVLHLSAGAQVGMDVSQGKLVVEATPVPEYTLDQLLAQCNPDETLSTEDNDWLNGNAAGSELI